MVLDFRARVKIAESSPKTLNKFVICHLHNTWPWEKAPCLYVCSRHIKKGSLYFTRYSNISLAESNFNFYFVWKFASAWNSISHCKLFDASWFYIVFCLHTKVVKGPPLTYIFALFWKTYDFLQSLRLQSGSSAFKQNNAKTKCGSLKEGSVTSLKKGGPETTALFAFPNIHPCSQQHTKERTGFILWLLSWLKSCGTS